MPTKDAIAFTVLGHAETQGSIKSFMVKGRPRLTGDNPKTKPWRQQVGMMALAERPTADIWAGRHEPVSLGVTFYLKAPAKPQKGCTRPSVKPDIDKLLRAILDAISGILVVDDGQVCEVSAFKRYGLPERAEIAVAKLF